MKKNLLVFVLFALITTVSFGQTPGPFYRQFAFNSYLFNPAYVAINDQPELNVVYRKQWINFKDAPVTTGVSLQYPTMGRVSLGLNIMNDQQVLLTNNTFMGTFGYVVPITENETIRFGLSAGVGTNKLDLTSEGINLNDPAIVSAASNNTYVDGNFGVVYTNKGLRVGFALTEIFKSDPFNAEAFNKFSLSNLKNRLYSVSYRFNVGLMENFSMEPYVLYRQSEDGLQDSWEAATMVYYKDILWTGASYNQDSGLGLFLGMNVLDKFRFSYSYEMPSFDSDLSSTSSHELHLGIRFGNKKSRALVKGPVRKTSSMANAKVVRPQTKDQPLKQQENEQVTEEKIKEESTTALIESSALDQAITTPAETSFNEVADVPMTISEVPEVEKTTTHPAKSFTLSKGHYVVVGAFSTMNNATRYARSIRTKGYSADVSLNPKKKLYYVYIFSSYDIEEARKARNQYRLKNLFDEAWLFSME